MNVPPKSIITPSIIRNHLFLKPPIKSITTVIMKYINTAPVSGSINVNIDGIPTTINTLIRNLNSSFVSIFLFSSLKSVIILDNVIIKNIFINSDGWKLPINGITNQHLALFISLPMMRTSINSDTPII